ncbi:MAG: argininosuccinate lyase [Bacteroidetes bacterium]|nr:argininosuccinate lyase [Bacteroidota bacterium]
MKLWDKGYSIESAIESFTVGKDRELDIFLAPFDILGTIAHITMLTEIGLIQTEELSTLKKELITIYQTTQEGTFTIEPGVEDVHSQVEFLLTQKLGDMGKKVHAGRSRNDQVLVDLKLYFLSEIKIIIGKIHQFFETLQSLSEKHKNTLLPGYTHTQVAMPSSFGLWFGAYAESLIDDVIMFKSAWEVSNQNPLGSAAGYGSSFPLNRTLTTQLLGFETLSYNAVYAQMGRGKTEKLLGFAISSLATTMNKLATDICLYMCQNFGFISFPKEFTTGSSIMPHKKNPDVWELMRARTNKLQILPVEIGQITTNLISGYHRDLQLVKESLLPAIEEIKTILDIADYTLSHIEVNANITDAEIYTYMFSVENVNQDVIQGMPFRDAYQKTGKEIAEGTFEPRKENLNHVHEGSIGNLCNQEIKEKMDRQIDQFNFLKADQSWEKLLA